MNMGKLKYYANYWCRNPDCRAVKVSKSVLESEFVAHLQTLKPEEGIVTEFPVFASKVWTQRNANTTAMIKNLKTRLGGTKDVESETTASQTSLRSKTADYVQANVEFDNEIEVITQELHADHSQVTLDAFLASRI